MPTLPKSIPKRSSSGGDNNDSIILEEEIDPTYEPSRDEVLEYAKWLGMNLPEDEDLIWIAREGLKAPLPENWKPCKTTDTEEIYYFNFSTGDSTWDHPCDEYYRQIYEEEKKKKISKQKSRGDEKDRKRKKKERDEIKKIVSAQTNKSLGRLENPMKSKSGGGSLLKELKPVSSTKKVSLGSLKPLPGISPVEHGSASSSNNNNSLSKKKKKSKSKLRQSNEDNLKDIGGSGSKKSYSIDKLGEISSLNSLGGLKPKKKPLPLSSGIGSGGTSSHEGGGISGSSKHRETASQASSEGESKYNGSNSRLKHKKALDRGLKKKSLIKSIDTSGEIRSDEPLSAASTSIKRQDRTSLGINSSSISRGSSSSSSSSIKDSGVRNNHHSLEVSELEAVEDGRDRHKLSMRRERREHEEELQKLKDECEDEFASMKSNYRRELSKLQRSEEKSLDNLKKRYIDEKNEIKFNFEKELEDLRSDLNVKKEKLKSEIEILEDGHKETLDDLIIKHENEVAKLFRRMKRDREEEARRQVERELETLQSTLNRELRTQKEAYEDKQKREFREFKSQLEEDYAKTKSKLKRQHNEDINQLQDEFDENLKVVKKDKKRKLSKVELEMEGHNIDNDSKDILLNRSEEVDMLSKKVEELEIKIKSLRAQHEKQLSALSDENEDLADELKRKMKYFQQEIDDYKDKITRSDSFNVNHIEELKSQQETVLKSLNNKIERYERKKNEYASEQSRLEYTITSLGSKLDINTAEKKEMSIQLEKLTSQLTTLKFELESKDSKLSNIELDNISSKSSLEKSNNDLSSKIESILLKNKELISENKTLNNRLRESNEQERALSDEITRVKEELDERTNSHSNEKHQLEQNLEILSTENSLLRSKKQELQESLKNDVTDNGGSNSNSNDVITKKEYEELSMKHSSLLATVERISTELAQTKESLVSSRLLSETYESELKDAKEQLLAISAYTGCLEVGISSSGKDTSTDGGDYSQLVVQLKNAVKSIEEKYETERDKTDKLQENLGNARNEFDRINALYIAATQAYTEADSSNTAMKVKIDSLESKLRQLQDESSYQSDELNTLKHNRFQPTTSSTVTSTAPSYGDVDALTLKVSEVELLSKNQLKTIEELQNEIQSQIKSRLSVDKKNESIRSDITLLESELGELKIKYNSEVLTTKISNNRSSQLTTQLSGVEERLLSAISERDSAIGESRKLLLQRASAQNEISMLTAERESLDQNVAKLTADNTVLQRKITSLETNMDQLNSDTSLKSVEVDDLSRQLNVLVKEKEELTFKVLQQATTKINLNETVHNNTEIEERNQLNAKLISFQGKCLELSQERDSLSMQKVQMEEKMHQLSLELNSEKRQRNVEISTSLLSHLSERVQEEFRLKQSHLELENQMKSKQLQFDFQSKFQSEKQKLDMDLQSQLNEIKSANLLEIQQVKSDCSSILMNIEKESYREEKRIRQKFDDEMKSLASKLTEEKQQTMIFNLRDAAVERVTSTKMTQPFVGNNDTHIRAPAEKEVTTPSLDPPKDINTLDKDTKNNDVDNDINISPQSWLSQLNSEFIYLNEYINRYRNEMKSRSRSYKQELERLKRCEQIIATIMKVHLDNDLENKNPYSTGSEPSLKLSLKVYDKLFHQMRLREVNFNEELSSLKSLKTWIQSRKEKVNTLKSLMHENDVFLSTAENGVLVENESMIEADCYSISSIEKLTEELDLKINFKKQKSSNKILNKASDKTNEDCNNNNDYDNNDNNDYDNNDNNNNNNNNNSDNDDVKTKVRSDSHSKRNIDPGEGFLHHTPFHPPPVIPAGYLNSPTAMEESIDHLLKCIRYYESELFRVQQYSQYRRSGANHNNISNSDNPRRIPIDRIGFQLGQSYTPTSKIYDASYDDFNRASSSGKGVLQGDNMMSAEIEREWAEKNRDIRDQVNFIKPFSKNVTSLHTSQGEKVVELNIASKQFKHNSKTGKKINRYKKWLKEMHSDLTKQRYHVSYRAGSKYLPEDAGSVLVPKDDILVVGDDDSFARLGGEDPRNE